MPTNLHAALNGPTLVPIVTSRSRFAVRKVNDVRLLDLTRSLTRDRLTQVLREQSQALLDDGTKNFVVNLSQVVYIDSSGVGALLAAYKFTEAACGNCKFSGAPPQVVPHAQDAQPP